MKNNYPSDEPVPVLEIPIEHGNPGDKFKLGQVCATAGVREAVCPRAVGLALNAHAKGEWGHVSKWDALANDDALKNGGRILSVWHGNGGIRFYIITSEDRSQTVVTLPQES